MKEVTKDEFYAHIGPLDVQLHIIEPFPYTTEFQLKISRKVVGKVIDYYADGKHHPIITKYLITQ